MCKFKCKKLNDIHKKPEPASATIAKQILELLDGTNYRLYDNNIVMGSFGNLNVTLIDTNRAKVTFIYERGAVIMHKGGIETVIYPLDAPVSYRYENFLKAIKQFIDGHLQVQGYEETFDFQ